MDMKQRLIRAMRDLVQRRGYSAVSYADVAERVKLRKASIHHHFPAKADLAAAVARAYREEIDAPLRAAEENGASPARIIEVYLEGFAACAAEGERVCLIGALAADQLNLEGAVQDEVRTFFAAHQDILTRTIRRGQESGAFRRDLPAENLARLFSSTCQGALLVGRATSGDTPFAAIAATLKAVLAAR